MSFLPARKPITIYQGDTVSYTVTYKEGTSGAEVGVDLTGATLAGQIKALDSATVVATFTVTADADQVTYPGKMSVVLPAAQSELLTVPNMRWDLEVTWPDTSVQTLLYGPVSVVLGVVA